MEKIYKGIDALIGNTPLLELNNYVKKYNLKSRLVAKLEAFNPGGSAKDRIARALLDDAEQKGSIRSGATIIEPTSGNTGVGLASVATVRGYKVVLTMPDTMSIERIRLLKAYGAEVVLTPGAKGMAGAIEKAEEIASKTENSYIPGQFDNPENPKAHFNSTGPEIWNDTDGKIDIFVAGVGTGGTVTGTGEFLKSKNPEIKVIAVEPAESPVLSGGSPGPHGLMGIGAGFVPEILNTDIYDEIITINTEEAYASSRELVKLEGILAGITSGAALSAALTLGMRSEYEGKLIVVLLPDTGERYLSTPLFEYNDI